MIPLDVKMDDKAKKYNAQGFRVSKNGEMKSSIVVNNTLSSADEYDRQYDLTPLECASKKSKKPSKTESNESRTSRTHSAWVDPWKRMKRELKGDETIYYGDVSTR